LELNILLLLQTWVVANNILASVNSRDEHGCLYAVGDIDLRG